MFFLNTFFPLVWCRANYFGLSIDVKDGLVLFCSNRTKLRPENTAEYKEREARAAAIAREIEASESYRRHSELENGDDGVDEESRFSAVVRNNSDSTSNNTDKSVPLLSNTTTHCHLSHAIFASTPIIPNRSFL